LMDGQPTAHFSFQQRCLMRRTMGCIQQFA
jgi:hypothetical protein